MGLEVDHLEVTDADQAIARVDLEGAEVTALKWEKFWSFKYRISG